jgi:hypothetical protein
METCRLEGLVRSVASSPLMIVAIVCELVLLSGAKLDKSRPTKEASTDSSLIKFLKKFSLCQHLL